MCEVGLVASGFALALMHEDMVLGTGYYVLGTDY